MHARLLALQALLRPDPPALLDFLNDRLPHVGNGAAEIRNWVAAHGVIIVVPVHWYQATSALKLMIDRLVCADGGNADPTSTGGKNPSKAKALGVTRDATALLLACGLALRSFDEDAKY